MKVVKRTLIPSVILIGVLLYVMAISVVAMSESPNEVDLRINSESETINTNAKTIKEVLDSVGYQYKETDRINHELDDRVSNEMEIVVSSEKSISLSEKGESTKFKTNASTVAEFLNEADIKLGSDDIVIPSLNSNLQDNDEVAIIYQKEEEYKETVDINYEVEREFSMDVPYGEIIVEQEGENGSKEEVYKKITKNDIVLSNKLISESVIKEPISEKIIIGTKEIEIEDISNETVTKKDSSMYKGESKVVNEGTAGIRELIYENTGDSKELISDKVTKDPVNKVIHEGTKEKPEIAKQTAEKTSAEYSLSQFQFHGVINSGGKKFTYYSQSVLPGGGLKIPGRHINAGGYVADDSGYIVVASNKSISKGTVIDTPFGYKGKVYDVCEACTVNWYDIYTK